GSPLARELTFFFTPEAPASGRPGRPRCARRGADDRRRLVASVRHYEPARRATCLYRTLYAHPSICRGLVARRSHRGVRIRTASSPVPACRTARTRISRAVRERRKQQGTSCRGRG